MREPAAQRLAGFLFGGWLLLHTAGFPVLWSVLSAGVLCAGFVLRWLQVRTFRPITWLLVGFTGVMPFLDRGPLLPTMGAAALWLACVLLLSPLTPRRGLWLLLACLVMLASLALDPEAEFSALAIIIDVAFVLLLAQQVHAPAGAGRGIREILLRSVLLAVPIASLVTGVFWVFPTLSQQTDEALSGFSGSLNPGDVSVMRLSRRPAFVATFSLSSPVPSAANLYWRGAVLVDNGGLNWAQGGRPAPGTKNAVPEDLQVWRYSLASQNGAPVVPLDVPLTEISSDVWLPDVVSSAQPADDPPDPVLAAGRLDVPAAVRSDPRLSALVAELISPDRSVPENLQALGDFLRRGDFVYSLRPGRLPSADVAGFLLDRRKGFCEHYAAACANILRLAGIPTRIITGYRGGRWNPWLGTITVQEADGHAWVEAWDAASAHWLRFDPTEFVAPELTRQIEGLRDDQNWAWHQRVSVFVASLLPSAQIRLERLASAKLLPILGGLALLLAGGWLWLCRRGRDPVDAVLDRLEKYAKRANTPRLPGETPLAWMARLQAGAGAAGDGLREIASLYEQCVYARSGPDAAGQMLSLTARWTSGPAQRSGGA